MSRKLFSKKAVSPVIATVLLIALVTAAAAIVYFVVMPTLQGNPEIVLVTKTFADQNGDDYADKLTLQIQNIGSQDAVIDSVKFFKYGTELNWTLVQTLPFAINVQTQTSLILTAATIDDVVRYPDKITIILSNNDEVLAIFDFTVDSKFSPIHTMYKEDFDDIPDGQSPEGWTYYLIATHGGGTHALADWKVQSGVLTYTQNDCNFIVLNDHSWDNVNISFDLKASDDDIMGIMFRYRDEDGTKKYYLVVFSNDHTLTDNRNGPHYTGDTMSAGKLYLYYAEDGPNNSGKLYEIASTSWTRQDNQWYNYVVVADGSHIKVYINGQLLLEATDTRLSQGSIGLLCGAMNGAQYDDILVWTGL